VTLESPTTAAASVGLTDPPTTKRWKITYASYTNADPGNGHVVSTDSREVIFTPEAMCIREESTPADAHGLGSLTVRATAMTAGQRRAIASMIAHLLRAHPHRGSTKPITLGPYSLGRPPDEGGMSVSCTIDVEGELWVISFAFGDGLPSAPPWLAPVYGN
jgi:hypothetical protein